MKILMLLSNPFTHDPRVYNEAVALIEDVHQVTVMGWDRSKTNPEKDEIEGIRVIRLRNTSYMDLLPYDIFRLRPFWRLLAKTGVSLHKSWPFDAVHCHDLDTLPAGVALKKKLGVKLIYDAHEIWGYMVARDLPGWWANHFLRKEQRLAPKADHVITVAEPIKKYFFSMGCKNVTLVMNCKPLRKEEYQPPDNKKLTILYVGGLNDSRFLLEAMDVCKNLKNVRFIVGGFGALKEKVEEKAKESQNLEFIGKVSMEQVLPLTEQADVVHCVFNPENKNNQIGAPNKVFEAMASGRPVIATKGTYSGELVGKNQIGVVVDYAHEAYKEAVERLRDDHTLREELGKNALEAAKKEYNWKKQKERLMGVYGGL